MDVTLHLKEGVKPAIFADLERQLDSAFPFPVNVALGEAFPAPADVVDLERDPKATVDIFAHEGAALLGKEFANLGRITSNYGRDETVRIFFVDGGFYHEAVQIVPSLVPIGAAARNIGGKDELVYLMNGVAIDKRHIAVGGMGRKTWLHASIIAHELYELLHWRATGKAVEDGRMLAHCEGRAGKGRCIMNPPSEIMYPPAEPYVPGMAFCPDCYAFLERAGTEMGLY